MCVYRHHILGSTADSQRAAALRLHSDTETLADDQMQWPVSLTHILRLVRLHGDSFVPYQRLGSAVHRKRYTSCVDVNRIGADMGEQGSRRIWLEEDISEHLRWSISLKSILNAGMSEFQAYELVDSYQFGKLLMLDGKLQSAEKDERAYHECLVQPAMLHHPNPRHVFICGGGEGATAREVLRHATVEKCVMVDIDEAVCNFCRENLEINRPAFEDPRLQLICDDARKQLEQYPGTFDVIIGDLADPVFGGPCYQLYTDDFYKNVVMKKLNAGGIFVTQSGPCGVLTSHEVFTPIHNTLKSSFPKGWNIAFKDPAPILSGTDMDKGIADKVGDSMWFLDGSTWQRICSLPKPVRQTIEQEQHILSVDNPKFIHGKGVKSLV